MTLNILNLHNINSKFTLNHTFSGITTRHGAPPSLQLIWMAILVHTDILAFSICLVNTTWDGTRKKILGYLNLV